MADEAHRNLPAGWVARRTGKMVPDGNGGLIEQVIIDIPGSTQATARLRPRPLEATIYFVGPEDGPIKIGFAVSLERRVRDLSLVNAYPLKLWASVLATPALEREYHQRFAAHRLHGEWFARHPDILAEIERLSSPVHIDRGEVA